MVELGRVFVKNDILYMFRKCTDLPSSFFSFAETFFFFFWKEYATTFFLLRRKDT